MKGSVNNSMKTGRVARWNISLNSVSVSGIVKNAIGRATRSIVEYVLLKYAEFNPITIPNGIKYMKR